MSPKDSLVVIDTNVWISGLLSQTGSPAQLTRRVVRVGQPVFSAATFDELKDRLWRPKFDRYISLEQRADFLRDLESIAHWVDVPAVVAARGFSRDATDDKFLHAALAAESPWLVSGDLDLLSLAAGVLPLGVRIVSAADAMNSPEFLPES